MQENISRIRAVALLPVLASVFFLAGCVTMPAETSALEASAEKRIALVQTFDRLWSMPGSFERLNHAAIINGTLYLAGELRGLQAVDVSNGHTRWIHIGKRMVDAVPVLHEKSLYLLESGQFVVVKESSGEELRRVRSRVGSVSPVFPGKISWMVAGGDGYVYGVIPESGARAWRIPAPGVVHDTAWDNEDLAYVATDNTLYAASVGTRAIAWSYAFDRQGTSALCLAGDIIYIGSSDFYLYAIDATSGVVTWSVSLGAPVMSKPTSAYGRVYASTMDNILYAVDTKTHSILWQLEADRVITATRNRVIFVRRTPAGDRVGIADSADGRVLGEIPAGRYETFVAEPESGVFYAISPQGDVLAIAEKGLKKGER